MTYIPIFISKQNVELKILENNMDLITSNGFIPYLEIQSPLKGGKLNPIVKRCRSALDCVPHFEQFNESTLEENLKMFKLFTASSTSLFDNIILSLKVTEDDFISNSLLIEDLLNKRHRAKQATAFRLASGTNLEFIRKLLELVHETDWLIIDLGEQDYSAAEFYLDMVSKLEFKQIAVFSIERHNDVKNEDFLENNYDYATEEKINISLIDEIKEGKYPFSFFGTYMGLRITMPDQHPRGKCYALFMAYNHSINKFYILVSDEKDNVGKVYKNGFKEKVKKDYIAGTLKRLFSHDIARQELEKTLSVASSASKFLYASVLHYLEEIAAMRL